MQKKTYENVTQRKWTGCSQLLFHANIMMQSGCWDDFILKNHFRVIPNNWLYNFDIWHFDKLLSAGEENVPWNVYAALTTTIRNKWNHLISEQKNMIFAARRHTHSYTYSQALPDKWKEWKRCNRLNIDSNIFYMQKKEIEPKKPVCIDY